MVKTAPDGRMLIQPSGNRVVDEDAIADALARSSAHLFSAEGRVVWVTGPVLGQLVDQHVASEQLVVRDGRAEVEYVSVVLDAQMIRAILHGADPHPRFGGILKGGSLADRLPKAGAEVAALVA